MSELPIGTVVGGVRIDAVTGRGGMGVVYRGRQLALNRVVAVKVVRDDLADSTEFRERFRRESEIAASLDHPHIVPIFSAGEDQDRLYVVMRHVDGTDLREMIHERGRLDALLAAEVVSQVGDALDAAHARGLVHRDVKPANILLSMTGGRPNAYLTDFGVSRLAADVGGLTRTGSVLGTLDYMAPEQFEGLPIDGRVDVYALGCVLYQALTGSVPFPRDTEPAKMFAHLGESPPSLATVARDVPAGLDAVVQHALAKRPADRTVSAGELGRAAVIAASGPPRVPAVAWLPPDARVEPPTERVPPEEPPPMGVFRTPTTPVPALPRYGAPTQGTPTGYYPEYSYGPPPGTPANIPAGPQYGPPPGVPAGRDEPVPARSRTPLLIGVGAAVLVVAALAIGAVVLLRGSGGGGGGGGGVVPSPTPAPLAAAGVIVGKPIPVGDEPHDIESGGDFLWATNTSDASVSKIDPRTGTAEQIPVGGVPSDLVVDQGGVWVWNYTDAVTRIDIATGEVSRPISTGDVEISNIAKGDGYLWLSHTAANTVTRLNMTTQAVEVDPIPVPGGPVAMALGNRVMYWSARTSARSPASTA